MEPLLFNAVETHPFGTTTLRTICFNGTNLFVAAGNSGMLGTSPDGVTWTLRTTPFTSSETIYKVAHNGINLFVAVGSNGKIATSSDGVTWTQRLSPLGTSINSVAYGNGLWVAVGSGGVIATSPDGVTWTQRSSPLGSNGAYDVIYYSNGGWTIVAASGEIATSSNGTTWTKITNPFSTSYIRTVSLYSVYGLRIAGGDSGKIATSTDNVTYTLRDSTFGSTGISAAYADSTHGAYISGYNKMAWSANGLSWQQISAPGYILGITAGLGIVVAVGSSGLVAIGDPAALSFQIAGTVTDASGQPASRTVRIYSRATGELLDEVVSNADTGSYSFLLDASQEVQRIVLADDVAEGSLFNDIIDRILPGEA